MIEIVNGKVYVDEKETVDPTLIGYAILDFAENSKKESMKVILNDDEFIESFIENVKLCQ